MPAAKPSKEQLAKLPAWARDYIKHLEGERHVAVRTLLKFQDEKTPTGIFTHEHVTLGERGTGPQEVRNYVQASRIYFRLPRDPDEWGMEVFVNEGQNRVEVRTTTGYPYIHPQGSNLFHIIPDESMLRPTAKIVLKALQEADALDHDNFVSKYGFSQAAIPQVIASITGKKD